MSSQRPVAAYRIRASSPVVGVVLLVGITALLAALCGVLVGFGQATAGPTPRATVDVTLDATDGWPDGQRLTLVHETGDPLDVADLAVVVVVERIDDQARVTNLPTRRLTAENVRGITLFDNGFAGIDGEFDAAHTDSLWASGETAELRIAQGEFDVRPGDEAVVRVIHRPTGGVIAQSEVNAA